MWSLPKLESVDFRIAPQHGGLGVTVGARGRWQCSLWPGPIVPGQRACCKRVVSENYRTPTSYVSPETVFTGAIAR